MASTQRTDTREAFKNALRETAEQHWYAVSVVALGEFKTFLTRAADTKGAEACVEDFYLQRSKEARPGQEPDLQNILQLTGDVAPEDRILFVTKSMSRAHKLDLAEIVLGVKVTGSKLSGVDAENDGIVLRQKTGKVHFFASEQMQRPVAHGHSAAQEEEPRPGA